MHESPEGEDEGERRAICYLAHGLTFPLFLSLASSSSCVWRDLRNDDLTYTGEGWLSSDGKRETQGTVWEGRRVKGREKQFSDDEDLLPGSRYSCRLPDDYYCTVYATQCSGASFASGSPVSLTSARSLSPLNIRGSSGCR